MHRRSGGPDRRATAARWSCRPRSDRAARTPDLARRRTTGRRRRRSRRTASRDVRRSRRVPRRQSGRWRLRPCVAGNEPPPVAANTSPYPPIGDYALIGDCHTAALVSRSASIDWCCFPRFDGGTTFGRLLDWDRGGHCQIVLHDDDGGSSRYYLEDTLVLVTVFTAPGG